MTTLKSLEDLKAHPLAVEKELDKVDDRAKRGRLEKKKRNTQADHPRLRLDDLGLKAFRQAAVKGLSKGQLRRIEKNAQHLIKVGGIVEAQAER